MGFLEIALIGVGLAMDAFAVSIAKGLAMPKINKKQMLIIAFFFGGFQALMPWLGYLLGSTFVGYITKYTHWIAFGMLMYVGIKMIADVIREDDEEVKSADLIRLDIIELLMLAVATSIDAFVVGITFSFYEDLNIIVAVIIIGVVTAIISALGVIIGHIFGSKCKKVATIAGGIILILIGLKILITALI